MIDFCVQEKNDLLSKFPYDSYHPIVNIVQRMLFLYNFKMKVWHIAVKKINRLNF